MTKALILEKGNVKRILEWFKLHKDEEYADILEGVVKEHREEFTLRFFGWSRYNLSYRPL